MTLDPKLDPTKGVTMTDTKLDTKTHPKETELADLLAGSLSAQDRERLESHVASCDECLTAIVAAQEAVAASGSGLQSGKEVGNLMKKINIYLILAIISFSLSFIIPQYFLQLLVATLILGAKWIIDARTTKMLIMIHDAWKKGGQAEASKIIEKIDSHSKPRF